VIKSSAEIESKREAAKSERRKQRASRKKWESGRKRDAEQSKNINALESDIEALERKSTNNYKASTAALKGLSKQVNLRESALEAKLDAISEGQRAEEASAARIAMKLKNSLVAAGGSKVEMMLNRALSDGRLSMKELRIRRCWNPILSWWYANSERRDCRE
jgi:hypothetical protein